MCDNTNKDKENCEKLDTYLKSIQKTYESVRSKTFQAQLSRVTQSVTHAIKRGVSHIYTSHIHPIKWRFSYVQYIKNYLKNRFIHNSPHNKNTGGRKTSEVLEIKAKPLVFSVAKPHIVEKQRDIHPSFAKTLHVIVSHAIQRIKRWCKERLPRIHMSFVHGFLGTAQQGIKRIKRWCKECLSRIHILKIKWRFPLIPVFKICLPRVGNWKKYVLGVCVVVIGIIVPVVLFWDKNTYGKGTFEYEVNIGNRTIFFAISDAHYDGVSLRTPYVVEHTIVSGDSLVNILSKHNVGNRTAMITALNKVFPARSIAVGQKLKLAIIGGGTDYEMASVIRLDLEVDAEKSVSVTWDRNTNVYTPKVIKRKLSTHTFEKSGEITLSLSGAMDRAGVKRTTVGRFINLFSFDTDFQRDIYKGDTFDIVYQEYMDNTGKYVKSGNILVAELSTLGGNRKRYYYYEDSKGVGGYYDYQGKSGRKFLMKTPIDGARLSSGFGNRKHPILGYTKHHNGTDFAAPTGTPIYAAGSGIVEAAGRKGGYGIYIRIRHNSTYKTAYAHMRGIARGVRTGTRVRQGQVIGYVGSTGRSTGPHLHYEVIKNGRHVNSRTLKLPSGRNLSGAELTRFKRTIKPYLKDGI